MTEEDLEDLRRVIREELERVGFEEATAVPAELPEGFYARWPFKAGAEDPTKVCDRCRCTHLADHSCPACSGELFAPFDETLGGR